MPRTAKRNQTMSGAPAQPISATPGQMYGAGVDQMELQRAMPAPNLAQGPVAQPVAPAPAPAPAQAAAPPPSFDQVLAQAQGMRDQTGLLSLPTMRPDEPVTAGLSRGPGGGPEMLQMQRGTPAGDALRRLSNATGDPYFANLAARGNA